MVAVTAYQDVLSQSFRARSLQTASDLNKVLEQHVGELDGTQISQLSQLRDQYLAAAGYGGLTGFRGAIPEAAIPTPSQALARAREQTVVRDHRSAANNDPAVRDHRSGASADPVVRDHRSGASADPVVRDHRSAANNDPAVRDHRSGASADPVVRDHRSGASADPVVRDHRNQPDALELQQLDLGQGSGDGWLSRLFDPQRRQACQIEQALKSNPQLLAAFEAAIGGKVLLDGSNDGKLSVIRNPAFGGAAALNPALTPLLGLLAGMNQANFGFGAAGLGAAGLGLGGLGAAGLGLAGGLGLGGFGLGAAGLGLAGGLGLGGLGLAGGLGLGGLGLAGGLGLGGLGLAGGLGLGGLGLAGGLGAAGLGLGGSGLNPFPGMMLGGLTNILGGMGGLQAPLGGLGAGSWNPLAAPGQINNTNPAYEAQSQAEIDGVLRDPSLTVEDKVTLMLMLIMKKMDKDIERQEQYVNSIQQQQSNRGGGMGGAGGMLGPIGGMVGTAFGGPMGGMVGNMLGGAIGGGQDPSGQNGSAPSIDIETTKLKRMIDKRSQMFDMLRQIIDKYNETAKSMIQSIGR